MRCNAGRSARKTSSPASPLRRLAAKAIGSQLKSRMGDLLMPRQLGYGTPRGCEAVVHAVRMYLHQLSPANAILKLDFSNAFNSIRRDTMLKAVGDLAPELLRFVPSLVGLKDTPKILRAVMLHINKKHGHSSSPCPG